MAFSRRVEAVGGFVQHEQPRPGQQCGGEPEPLAHAEGEAAGPVVGDVGEPDLVEHVVDAGCTRVPAAEFGQRGEVLPGGERRVEAGSVHESGDRAGDGERPADRRPQDLQAAAVGDGQAQQEPEQCGLAGAVRPDQAVDLSPRHIEVDAVERHDLAEALGDPAGPDGVECVHESLASLLSRSAGTLGTTPDPAPDVRLNAQGTNRQGLGK